MSKEYFPPTVIGFGIDPDYQIDIINELDFANAIYGITQVAGLHKNSKAFLFRGNVYFLSLFVN